MSCKGVLRGLHDGQPVAMCDVVVMCTRCCAFRGSPKSVRGNPFYALIKLQT